jgi:hypothetical protein
VRNLFFFAKFRSKNKVRIFDQKNEVKTRMSEMMALLVSRRGVFSAEDRDEWNVSKEKKMVGLTRTASFTGK